MSVEPTPMTEIGETLLDLDFLEAEGKLEGLIVFAIMPGGRGQFTYAGKITIDQMRAAAVILEQVIERNVALLCIQPEGHG